MPKENRPTLVFVIVALMAVVAAFLSELDIHPWRLVGYACALIFEFWAIANNRKGDTISEGFWELSARPFVPWSCGALFLYFTMNGTITDVREIAALAGLQMHFFWQADTVYREISAKEDRL